MVDVDVGRRSIIVGRVVHVLLLRRHRRRRRAMLPYCRRYVQLLIGTPAYCRGPVARGVEARVGCWGRRRGQVAFARSWGIRAALRHEGVGAGSRGALGGASQVASRRSYA
jgi:hypothetical protein